MGEPRLFDASAVVHVHSTYSDGTATVPELLAAAADTGVDVLLLTDHDTLAAQRDGWEGRHNGVLLLVGTEVSPRHGHYLAFGVDREIEHDGRSPLEIATAVRAAGDDPPARLARARAPRRLRRHRAVEPHHRRGRGLAHAGRGGALAARS